MGLLNVSAHVGHDPYISRVLRRPPVENVFGWVIACTGVIGGPARTCFGLHKFHARPVRTAPGDCEGYSCGGLMGPLFYGALSHMALGHGPYKYLYCFYNFT